MAYTNTFSDGGTVTLASQTSDSGHTHTKRVGAGTMQVSAGLAYPSTGADTVAYTASWVPAGADQEATCQFVGNTGDNCTVEFGLHCETDGDGIWLQWENFTADPGQFNLYETVGGADNTLDTFLPGGAGFPRNFTVVLRVESNLLSWTVAGVTQGSGIAFNSALNAAGLVGLKKFNGGSATVGLAMTSLTADVVGGGGGTTLRELAATGVGV
jgi:hypothetical protein